VSHECPKNIVSWEVIFCKIPRQLLKSTTEFQFLIGNEFGVGGKIKCLKELARNMAQSVWRNGTEIYFIRLELR